MPQEPIRVLSLSPDPRILALRHKVLSKAGFVVSSPSTARQILAEIEQHQFDVLVVGHRWPTVAMQELTEEFKRRNPTGCVVGITALPWMEQLPMADITVYAADGPDTLIEAIRKCKSSSQ
jgi:DNA-binding NtrC family response regulator